MSSACTPSAMENMPASAWDLKPDPLGPHVSAAVRRRREASKFRETDVFDDAYHASFSGAIRADDCRRRSSRGGDKAPIYRSVGALVDRLTTSSKGSGTLCAVAGSPSSTRSTASAASLP